MSGSRSVRDGWWQVARPATLMLGATVLGAAALAACGAPDRGPGAEGGPAAARRPDRPAPKAEIPPSASLAGTGAPPGAAASPPTSLEDQRHRLPPPSRVQAALAVGAGEGWPPAACAGGDEPARARCLLDRRWRDAGSLHATALELWDRHRVAIGLEPDHWMDGGFRGRLHLVPEPPVGPHARHLGWVREAHEEIAEVLAAVAERAPPEAPRMRFRHEGIVYGFFRSVGRTTPSAYASGWRVGYNVAGSLHTSRDAVRDTIFHEIVHLHDHERPFARRLLGALHDGIVARCGARSSCLAPFAPTKTAVRGGTYYAFQPDNGDAVDEYAAEVATRWFQEHRAIVRGTSPGATPFRCGAPENEAAWRAVAGELFGGVDLVPACGGPGSPTPAGGPAVAPTGRPAAGVGGSDQPG